MKILNWPWYGMMIRALLIKHNKPLLLCFLLTHTVSPVHFRRM